MSDRLPSPKLVRTQAAKPRHVRHEWGCEKKNTVDTCSTHGDERLLFSFVQRINAADRTYQMCRALSRPPVIKMIQYKHPRISLITLPEPHDRICVKSVDRDRDRISGIARGRGQRLFSLVSTLAASACVYCNFSRCNQRMQHEHVLL
jgi:hypothetical protein